VFRFKNRYSVFLHDTSTPSAFERDVRALSHGCVRVSRPFDLARFVLDNPDEWLLDRIRIGMGQQPESEQGMNWVSAHPDKEAQKKIIGHVGVKPHVPLYIIYNTMWPDESGVWREWPDVYGYDDVIWKQMQSYMQ
jgi:murein L,D-transpeptidase YcbB/YkuD